MVTLHPLSGASSWLKSHAGWLLAASWLLGSVYAYIPTVHTYVVQFTLLDDSGEDSQVVVTGNSSVQEAVTEAEVDYEYLSAASTVYYQCSYQNDISEFKLRAIVLANFLFTFLLPLVLITAAYAAIIRRLKRRRRLLQLQKERGVHNIRFFEPFSTLKQQQQQQQRKCSDQSTSTSSYRGGVAVPVSVRGGSAGSGYSGSGVKSGGSNKGRGKEACNCSSVRGELGVGSRHVNSGFPVERQSKVSFKFNLFKKIKNAHFWLQTIKMIFTVVLLYCICLLPFKTLQLLFNFKLISYCTEWEFTILLSVYIAFHWMAMAHSCVNPIIYSYMSRSFRVRSLGFYFL